MEQTEEQKKERVNRCIEKIRQLLVEENCIMQPSITINGSGKILGQMLIVAQDLVQIKEEAQEEVKEETING